MLEEKLKLTALNKEAAVSDLRKNIAGLKHRLKAKEDEIKGARFQHEIEGTRFQHAALESSTDSASAMVKTIQFFQKKVSEKEDRIGDLGTNWLGLALLALKSLGERSAKREAKNSVVGEAV